MYTIYHVFPFFFRMIRLSASYTRSSSASPAFPSGGLKIGQEEEIIMLNRLHGAAAAGVKVCRPNPAQEVLGFAPAGPKAVEAYPGTARKLASRGFVDGSFTN